MVSPPPGAALPRARTAQGRAPLVRLGRRIGIAAWMPERLVLLNFRASVQLVAYWALLSRASRITTSRHTFVTRMCGDLHGIQIRMRMCSAMPSNGVAATLKLVASCCRRRREERAPGTPPRPHKKGGPNLGPPCHINDEFAKPFSLFLAPLVQVAEVRLERGVARGDRASGSTGHGRRAHGRTGGRGRRRRRTRAVGSR